MNEGNSYSGDRTAFASSHHEWVSASQSQQLAELTQAWLNSFSVESAVDLGPRIKFKWPPAGVAALYNLRESDWTRSETVSLFGETFQVQFAKNSFGTFLRCPALWIDVKGNSEKMCQDLLRERVRPYFKRMEEISKTLNLPSRFQGRIQTLDPLSLVKLLFCMDRDVVNEAELTIERSASSRLFVPALVAVLTDAKHPCRRSAQWAVLDMFEDLPEYSRDKNETLLALDAIKHLIWNSSDDIARTTYKAGVVLGGHLAEQGGGELLLECLACPNNIGKRSAIHGLFHVVEWNPSLKETVVNSIRELAKHDPNPTLRDYAIQMAHDIESEEPDHIDEPVFPEEISS